MSFVENTAKDVVADWRMQVRMLIGASFGFLTAVFVGVASADETPTSVPGEPDVALAPAVVVSAGANAINTNAVSRISALSEQGTEYGTGVALDDGRIGTVAHALIDARSIGIGTPAPIYGPLRGPGAVDVTVDSEHDLASFVAFAPGLTTATMSVAAGQVQVGDQVALAGYGRDDRLAVVAGEVIYRGSGSHYGVERPEIIVVSAEVAEGWSGGPVANVDGGVVAIIVGREQVSGVAIAVPIEYLP